MTISKFFEISHCKFGDRCRNTHAVQAVQNFGNDDLDDSHPREQVLILTMDLGGTTQLSVEAEETMETQSSDVSMAETTGSTNRTSSMEPSITKAAFAPIPQLQTSIRGIPSKFSGLPDLNNEAVFSFPTPKAFQSSDDPTSMNASIDLSPVMSNTANSTPFSFSGPQNLRDNTVSPFPPVDPSAGQTLLRYDKNGQRLFRLCSFLAKREPKWLDLCTICYYKQRALAESLLQAGPKPATSSHTSPPLLNSQQATPSVHNVTSSNPSSSMAKTGATLPLGLRGVPPIAPKQAQHRPTKVNTAPRSLEAIYSKEERGCRVCRIPFAKEDPTHLELCSSCSAKRDEAANGASRLDKAEDLWCVKKCGQFAHDSSGNLVMCTTCLKKFRKSEKRVRRKEPKDAKQAAGAAQPTPKSITQRSEKREETDPNVSDPRQILSDDVWQSVIANASQRIYEIKTAWKETGPGINTVDAAQKYIKERRQALKDLASSHVEDLDGSLHAHMYGQIRVAELYIKRKEGEPKTAKRLRL